jgi:hypothetical protein
MPLVTGKRGSSKRVAELFELAAGPDLRLPGAASHDLPEAGELDLERNGAPATAGSLAVLPDLVNDLPQRIARSFVGEEIGGKGVLGTDGFPYPIGAYGPLIDAARSPIIVGPTFRKCCLRNAKVCALRSSPVSMASCFIFLAVAGPTP